MLPYEYITNCRQLNPGFEPHNTKITRTLSFFFNKSSLQTQTRTHSKKKWTVYRIYIFIRRLACHGVREGRAQLRQHYYVVSKETQIMWKKTYKICKETYKWNAHAPGKPQRIAKRHPPPLPPLNQAQFLLTASPLKGSQCTWPFWTNPTSKECLV